MPPYRAETTSDLVRSLSRPKLETTNEGNGSPDREPQSPSRSISQTVSVAACVCVFGFLGNDCASGVICGSGDCPVRSLSYRKLEMANEGIGSPDHEPQSPSRSINQTVSVADGLGQTVFL